MRRKPTVREPTPKEEGEELLEQAAQAGEKYAREQLDGEYFCDWVWEQLVEADRMRRSDPSSVVPLETPADARRLARSMLQQLGWDTKRDLDRRAILDLTGAAGVFGTGSADWVLDTYGITYKDVSDAFFAAFDEVLENRDTRQWLADVILEDLAELGGGEKDRVVEDRRRPSGRSRLRGVVRDYVAVDHRGRTVAGPFTDYGEAKREADRAGGYVKFAIASEVMKETTRGLEFHVPPANQGQIVEVAYALSPEGLIERTFDRSDRSTSYRIHAWTRALESYDDPWNRPPPNVRGWKRISAEDVAAIAANRNR
jgi:hypothetical protein